MKCQKIARTMYTAEKNVVFIQIQILIKPL